MPAATALKVRPHMPIEIDDENLRKYRKGGKPEMVKRNYYTEPARLELIDAAVKKHGFKSFNKFVDAASEWFIAALEEKAAQAKKGAKK